MGGDDLDDDYLLDPVVEKEAASPKRRARNEANPAAAPQDDGDDNIDDDDSDDSGEPASKKRKKLSDENVLIQAGCGIESSTLEDQVSFLTASLKHYSLMAGNDDTHHDFGLTTKSVVTSSKHEANLAARIRDVISMKRLKKHRETGSPAVVIVCQSARRAVEVLKEVTDLRLRAIKLFPKNGEIHQQVAQLQKNSFALAVGTPHRLAALCRHDNGLSLATTQLVVLDSYISKKQYTVCTLPDTAADTMELLREHVLPQLKINKNLRLAFL